MRCAIAVGLMVVAAARPAAACDVTGPHLGTLERVPLGCPIYVYGQPDFDPGFEQPRLTALRGSEVIEVSGDATETTAFLGVQIDAVDCELDVLSTRTEMQPFTLYAIPLVNVVVGDRVGLGEGWVGGIEITAAGTCSPSVAPQLTCLQQTTPCFTTFPGGEGSEDCSAGGGGTLGVGVLVALAAVLRRRRR